MKPSKIKTPWTREELEKLITLRQEGVRFSKIATIIGRSRGSVKSAWHRYVLPKETVVYEKPVVNCAPTLAYVPHLWPNPRYKMKSECSANAH